MWRLELVHSNGDVEIAELTVLDVWHPGTLTFSDPYFPVRADRDVTEAWISLYGERVAQVPRVAGRYLNSSLTVTDVRMHMSGLIVMAEAAAPPPW